MEKVIIFGIGEFAKLMKYYIDSDKRYKLVAATVDSMFINSCNKDFYGIPLVPFEGIDRRFSKEDYKILVAIGYSNMNRNREIAVKRCSTKGYKLLSYIHPSTRIADNCSIGIENIFLEDVLVQPFVKIGNSNIFWYKSVIAHDTKIGNYNTFAGMSSISGDVTIGNNCFFGNNCTVRDKVIINDFTLIGAGAYINHDTKNNDVYVPQKVVQLKKNSLEIII